MKKNPKVVLSLMVEPAVKKYLAYHHKGVYIASLDKMLGAWLITSISPKHHCQKIDQEADWYKKRMSHLTQEFRFSISYSHLQQLGTFINAHRSVYFNNMVLKTMYMEMMINIAYAHLYNQEQIQRCIDDFRNKYGIFEEELPDERIRKKYLRLRNSYGSKEKFRQEFSPGDFLVKI